MRFAGGERLEDLILRHALGRPQDLLSGGPAGEAAGGVMMIPIPASGVLKHVSGADAARAEPGISELSITVPLGQTILQLPEGGKYLGFIIAHGADAETVAGALRAAHAHLGFEIEPA